MLVTCLPHLKVLLLNQTFYPDVMATGQYLTEVAIRLVERGHRVTVLTSRRAYDDPEQLFPKAETWHGIRIIRIGSTGFGKTARWRRAADFASFLSLCACRLAFLPRHDVIVALTSPPLISFLGAWLAKLRGSRFYYWVMDFNPDEAIAAGWLRSGSTVARLLDSMSRFSLKRANRVIALDRFMRDRIIAKGIPAEKVSVVPPWSHDSKVHFDAERRERFRKVHNLDGKFVVMYSGNHSPCHPLDTLLEAARRLAVQSDIVFCFIGGGSEWRKIKEKVAQVSSPASSASIPVGCSDFRLETSDLRLPLNILCLPYQPLSELSGSLSAADLHVVVMGDPFVGLVHPCKIYNVLQVASPVLYIGPVPSHISEIAGAANGELLCLAARHGDVEQVVEHILRARTEPIRLFRHITSHLQSLFGKEAILPKLIAELESA